VAIGRRLGTSDAASLSLRGRTPSGHVALGGAGVNGGNKTEN
jgi:hypothetical protein